MLGTGDQTHTRKISLGNSVFLKTNFYSSRDPCGQGKRKSCRLWALVILIEKHQNISALKFLPYLGKGSQNHKTKNIHFSRDTVISR